MIIDNLLNAEEAWKAVKEGYFVTSGGYTYYKDGYFAYGTFPGCIRTGKITRESFEGKHWLKLDFPGLIKHTGYFPCSILNMTKALKGTPYEDEALYNEVNMIHFMINAPHTAEDFRNTFKVESIWSEYFNPKDMDDDRSSIS